MKRLTKSQIHERLDKLVDKMDGRELICSSWYDSADRTFEPEQVRGTFDFILDGNSMGSKKYTTADVMRWANDLWREACKY
jgi:hypothetical protein